MNKYIPSRKKAIATFASGMGFVILLLFTSFVIGFAAHITVVLFQEGWRFYAK